MTDTSSISSLMSQYKYKIQGKSDLLFYYTGKLLANNDFSFNILKNKRMRALNEVTTIKASGADAQVIKKEVAEARLSSVKEVYASVKDAIRSKDAPKDNAKALSQITSEIELAITDYTSARTKLPADTDPAQLATDDAKFVSDTQYLLTSISSAVSRLKVYLQQAGVVFSTDLNSAQKDIKAIQGMLDQLTAPPAAAAADAGDGSIVVDGMPEDQPSAAGNNVDLTV